MKQKIILNLIPIAFLCLIGILLFSSIKQYADVLFWDEANYLVRSEMFWHHIPKTWGPTYSLWYKILSYIQHDKVNLYYLNYALLGIINPILAYWIFIRLNVNTFVAFVITLLFLIHPLNVETWPRISHYCVMIIFISVILSTYIKDNIIKVIVFNLCFLFLAFARPEFYLTFLISLILLIFILFKEKRNTTKWSWTALTFLFICFILSYKVFKTPFNNGDSGRSIGVFYQHFALNYTIWNNSNSVFWLDFYSILHDAFGNKIDLWSIIKNENGLFWKHIGSNITNTIKYLSSQFFQLLLPFKAIKEQIIFFIIYTIALIIIFVKNKQKYFFSYIIIKRNYILFLLITISVFAPLFFSIYAYPRAHYLYLLFPFMMIILAFLFQNIKIQQPIFYTFLISILFLIFPLKAKDYNYFDLFRNEKSLSNAKSIQYLKNKYKNTQDTISIFDVEGNMSSLLPKHFKNIIYNPLNDSLLISSFITLNNPTVIYITPTLLSLNKAKNDSILLEICLKPQHYGYIKRKTGNFKPYLLIKNE